MWQPSGSFQTRQSSTSRHEIHVLLVDHDRDFLMYMADQLETLSYKVTTVGTGRVAMSMLTKGKREFDLLLADTNLPDLDVIKLLQVAVHLELPSILMTDEYDKLVAEMAVNNGAILLLQKPFGKETTRNFWQYVMKERTPKHNTIVPQDVITEIIAENGRYFSSNTEMVPMGKGYQTDNRRLNGLIPKRTKRKKYNKRYVEESDSQENYTRPNKVKRKACTEWTEELHTRFVNAVNHLGDGRCYPKEILDLMNVPGLTRMQVASHLQKCRNDDWRAPNIRRPSYPYSMGIAPTLSIHKASISNARKFGAMPSPPKKRNVDDTPGRGMHASNGDKVQNVPNTSTLENQNIEQGIPVTLPLSQSILSSLPLSLENATPMRFMPTPTLKTNVDGPFGRYHFPDNTITIPTMDKPSSDFVVDTNAVPQPPAQQEFGTSVDTPSFSQVFDFSSFSDLNLNGDFLSDMDGVVNNINGVPEPSSTTYPSSNYQHFVNDFPNVFADQNAMTTDNDIGSLWTMGTSNVLDQP